MTSPTKEVETLRAKSNREKQIGVADKRRGESERNVLRGLVQQPLVFWPNACSLRDADFIEYRPLFIIVRNLICSAMLEKREQQFSEKLIESLVAELRLSFDKADLSALFEGFHESKFIESVSFLRNDRLMTLVELEIAGKTAGQCEAIREATVGVTGGVRGKSFAGIDASELEFYAAQEPDWLVQDLFTIDEPLLVGARSKGCKTLQLTDLAVAIASATQWMNTFDVPKRRRVLFITGEANRRRTAFHVEMACQVRGIRLADLTGFLRVEAIEFPCLPSIVDQDVIRSDIRQHGIEVVIVDPLYRGLSGVDASRLSEMGHAIKSFQAACAPACLILSHHVVKSAAKEYGQPPQLEDMTGAGIAESCGQWWLVGRNNKYSWDWMHDLCVQFGGREGQAGGRRILFNEADWRFDVDPLNEYRSTVDLERQQQQDAKKREAEQLKRRNARAKITGACKNVKTPQSRTRIRDASGQSSQSIGAAFAEMVKEQLLVQRAYRDGANRIQTEGYILAEYAAEYDLIWQQSDMQANAG